MKRFVVCLIAVLFVATPAFAELDILSLYGE